jgi:DNA repair photolyase
MIIKEIYSKNILSKSKVMDYTINPYIGCEHSCTYCYARFMKRFTGHREEWGTFVDVKINAKTLLEHELKKKQTGQVWISGICDPYQPLEQKYELTYDCLNSLLEHAWPVTIQTKSPLVLRDLDLLKKFEDITVGFTITTADDSIRRIFEPNAPPIKQRIEALETLQSEGISTFAMIAPILPNTKALIPLISGKVDYVLVDKMNYHYADQIFKKHRLEYAVTPAYFLQKKKEFKVAFEKEGIPCQVLF